MAATSRCFSCIWKTSAPRCQIFSKVDRCQRPADATSERQTDEGRPLSLSLSAAAGVNLSAPRSSRILSQLLAGGKSNKQKDKWRARKRGETKRGETAGLVPPTSSISPTRARSPRKRTFHTKRWRIQPTCHLCHNQHAHLLCRVPLPETSASVPPPPRLIISPSSIYGPLSALFSLLPHTHSSNHSSPPRSGPFSPSSFLHGHAEVMNGTLGIFGSETCYYAVFSNFGLFFPAAAVPAWVTPSGGGERAEAESTSERVLT